MPSNIMKPEELALKHMLKVAELIENSEKSGKGIRSRARELPSLLLDTGLAQVMTFYMSKGSENSYKAWVKYLGGIQLDNNEEKDLLSELEDKEGKGYSTLLAMLVHALREFRGLVLDDFSNPSFKGLAGNILGSLVDFNNSITASSILLPYLIELKKLATALIPSGSGEG